MHYFCGAAWPSPSQHVDTHCWMCGRNVPELQHQAEQQCRFVGSGPNSYSKEIQEKVFWNPWELQSQAPFYSGKVVQQLWKNRSLPERKQKDVAVCDSIHTY